TRIKHDRNARAGHDDTPDTLALRERKGSSLKALLRQAPALGEKRVWVAPQGQKAGRWATVRASAAAVPVSSPPLERTGRALRCWAVRVWEADPPAGAAAGAAALEWMLLTSLPVNDRADALTVAEYYGLRWLIEEYHKCLKSGCRVEARQLESA